MERSTGAFTYLLAKTVKPHLELQGFSRRGQNLFKYYNGNWALVNFQKSRTSTQQRILFTINIGVACGRILKFYGVPPDPESTPDWRPTIADTHWRIRLGQLISGAGDLWWTIDNRTNVAQLGQEIIGLLLGPGLQELNKYIGDEGLRDLWLSGHSPGLTEFDRLAYLSILLKDLGPPELLEPTLRELQRISTGRPSAVSAEVHIERLRREMGL